MMENVSLGFVSMCYTTNVFAVWNLNAYRYDLVTSLLIF